MFFANTNWFINLCWIIELFCAFAATSFISPINNLLFVSSNCTTNFFPSKFRFVVQIYTTNLNFFFTQFSIFDLKNFNDSPKHKTEIKTLTAFSLKTLPFCRRCRSRDLFTTEQITMLNQYIQLPSADCMNASSTLSAIQLEQFLCLSYPALFVPLPYTHSRIHTMFVLFYLVFTAEFESICCAHVIVLVG